MSAWLTTALARLAEPDGAARDAVRARADDLLRPRGALAHLDDLAVHIAGWQRSTTPRIERPAGIVFAADHGVAAASAVSAYPVEVTTAMLEACRAGAATISALAQSVGAVVSVVDVGVGRPTGDIRCTAALTPERFEECLAAGAAAIDALDTDLVVLGEIGIGNTTAAAALVAVLLGGDPVQWIGRGTGVDDDGLARKRDAVATVQRRLAGVTDPLQLMREAGGAELVAIAGAAVQARLRSIPVLLDGYAVTAAVLPLELARPGALDHCLLGHCSAEPGHRRVIERLGLRPTLSLDMRLGEGSGAMLAVPIVRAACDAVVDVATFTEWFHR